MQLTVIAGDDISSLEVIADIEIEILVSLCKIELSSIADIPVDQLQIICNGQKFVLNSPDLLKKQLKVIFTFFQNFIYFLKDFNIQDGDAIHFGKVQQTAVRSVTPTIVPTSSTSGGLSTLISSLVKTIKIPTKRPSEGSQDRLMAERIFDSLSEPVRLDFLRANFPKLAAAYEANPSDKGFI